MKLLATPRWFRRAAGLAVGLGLLTQTQTQAQISGGGINGPTAAYIVSLFPGTADSAHCLSGAQTLVSCSGAGAAGFDTLTSGTNVTAAMLVGSGASLGPTGSGTITANALSGSLSGTFTTLTSTGLANLASGLVQAANTSVIGSQLIDSTAATVGNQQFSPAFLLEGKGWGTTSGTSQAVDFKTELQPVQSTVPTCNLVYSSQVAGGGYTAQATLGGCATNGQWLMPSGAVGTPSYSFSSTPNTGMYGTATAINFTVLGGNRFILSNTTNNSQQKLQLTTSLESAGTAFTIASGTGACATTTTLLGGAVAGHFTCTGTTGASTATLTMATAAAHAYICLGRDVTTPTTVTQTGAISTTSVTLTLVSVTANDVIQFACPIEY